MTSLWLDNPVTIPTDPFVADGHFDEVVVGAGITGLVAAVMFARRGRRVAVLEARTVGAVTTGNTTAKISQLQGTHFQKIKSHGYQAMLRAYADGNRDAFDWLIDYCAAAGVPLERRDAFTYAATPQGVHQVEREYELARSVGLDVEMVADAGLPFPTFAAVKLPDQAQFDPLDLLAALARELRELGGVLHEDARVLAVRASNPAHVITPRGELTADHVILATGTPILDRGLYFAKVEAQRSYGQAFAIPEESLPNGMYLGVETPTRSIRTHRGLLVTGGNGHVVGREPSPQQQEDNLTEWTKLNWPDAVLTHSWSAQDYSPAHHVPFVGWLPRGRGRIFLATGFDKWGMTNGVAAALILVADVLGDEKTQWQTALRHRITMPRAFATAIGRGAAVGWWYAKGYGRALATSLPDAPPAEGDGVVGRSGLRPTAVSTVDGVTCELSAICSHLAAVVTWNDAEKSWDCPAHGSRFAADGTRLEGPAIRDLAP